jgi:hypothetical protein
MADTKVSDLTALTGVNAAGGDLATIVDISDTTMAASGTNKKMTLDELVIALQARGMPRVKRLTADHSISSTTATEVTDLEMALEAGTFTFKYSLICQSGTATTGLGLGINFSTGTAAVKAFMRYNTATITTASNGLTEEESGAALTTGGVMNAWASKAYSTTAPTMVSAGVGAVDVDTFEIIEGIIIVTVAGNLELWHSSETAAATRVETNSSLVVVRTA